MIEQTSVGGPETVPHVSVVIPARNEELCLAATIESVQAAVAATGLTGEIIVVDDASDDRTADIARGLGCSVVPVELHNIGAVRNAGAKQARGQWIVFLDADTLLPAGTLKAALRAMDDGAVGGGAWVTFDKRLGWFQRGLAWLFCLLWQRVRGWAAGCFIYCRRVDFEAVGGFDEQYFAAEERFLSEALMTRGKFVILKESVITSARKLRLFSTGKLLWIAVRTLCTGRHRIQQREGLEILYDAPREKSMSGQ
ncbi:MAG: glycosyltransferase [Planctomycetaceae bacterium]